MGTERVNVDFFGTIQGVGFRPYLYWLADRLALKGRIQNRGDRVRAYLEGSPEALKEFLASVRVSLPEHAVIERMECEAAEPEHFKDLLIVGSESGDALEISIPVDLATCPECIKEFLTPSDRRYLYPFIACTRCGPRYSVVTGMPYDRERTTLSAFPLCPACRAEYENPLDRRYHAESTACPVCGPRLSLLDASGVNIGHGDSAQIAALVASALREGKIVAIRGMGGFQLAVDAANASAIARLRERKRRPRQPFAVMARSLEAARRVCLLGGNEAELLTSSAAPIVIADAHDHEVLPLDHLSDGAATLGVMVPTTAIHHLLFNAAGSPDFLVMTSGNRHDEPLSMTTPEALERLGEIADLILTHDREIQRRCDDSIYTANGDLLTLVRAGRGVAPLRLNGRMRAPKTILALGADLKNTIALAWGDRLAVSPHIGNLGHVEAYRRFVEEATDFPAFFATSPEVIAVDLHPGYVSSDYGRTLARRRGLELIEVQHHHAHALACMVEHGLREALAVTFDGTGYGPDGTLWGGELLHVTPDGYERKARLKPAALPGGEKAIREPWRQSCARLVEIAEFSGKLPPHAIMDRLGVSEERYRAVSEIALKRFNAPLTSAAGRLFDSVSALLGLSPHEVSYEGEAAIRLEHAARSAKVTEGKVGLYPYTLRTVDHLLETDTDAMIRTIYSDVLEGRAVNEIALMFHETLARMAAEWVDTFVSRTGVRAIVLTGGVFQNKLLHAAVLRELCARAYSVYSHALTPTGDGCISFGQLAAAAGGFDA